MATSKDGSSAKPKKKVTKFRFNSTLDNFLTVVYLAVVCYLLYVFYFDLSTLTLFFVLIGVTAVGINLTKAIFAKFGLWLSATFLSGAPFNHPLSSKLTMRKWCDQSWQLVIHVSMSIFELLVLADETWFSETMTCWMPHPFQQTVKPSLRVLYLTQLAIWIYTAFSHRFIEERKKDYFVMYIHHIATILLVAGSFIYNYTRIGLLVLLCHDVSDIFIDAMKMVNYLKLESAAGRYMSECAYFINMIGWIYFRLYIFPTRVIYSALYESHLLLASRDNGKFWVNFFDKDMPLYGAMVSLLVVLFFLHIWWFALLVRIGYKAFNTQGVNKLNQTGAEQYEGDSDHED